MSDATSPKKTYVLPMEIWAGVLIIVGFTAYLLAKDDKPVKVQKEESTPTQSANVLAKLDGVGIQEAIPILEKYAKRAQQIIPFFPPFPKVWLNPPMEKGEYGSLGERYCIEFMEILFPGHKFPKVRPAWLKNTVHKTNRCLELDGYCEDLAIALEYNGVQHYEWPNFTGMTWEQFMKQRERDQLKEEVCIEKKICLIRIPYTVPNEKIPIAIYAKLLEAVPGLIVY